MPEPTDADLSALPPTPLGLYRHYKGGWYEVIDTVRCSETLQPQVLYRALYGGFGLWVRPAAMFNESGEFAGAHQRRFAPCGHDHAVLQVPGGFGIVAVDGDLRMTHPVLGEDRRRHGRAHELDQVVTVGEVVLLAQRGSVPADDVLGEGVGEIVPVLGVQRPQIAVFHPFDRLDRFQICHARHCNTPTGLLN